VTDRVFGDTSNLKASQSRALERLLERSVPADRIISSALARDLLDLSRELNRRIGLFLDRRGLIEQVILGDAHSIDLPEFERVRGAAGRLRGVRLVVTHLVPDPLDREELADLTKLRLDLICAIHRGAAGIAADVAHLEAGRGDSPVLALQVLDRVSLSKIAPDDLARADDFGVDFPFPLDRFLREVESRLVAATGRAAEERSGKSRAMVLMSHPGGKELPARQAEMHELCRTAGIEVVELVVQRRPYPDPRTFFGTGKLAEILVRALEQDVDVLICDPELTASQARTIADQTELNVIDRTMLILDIFAQHAQSSDGKMQVELAQLRYRLPRLLGKGTMMSRLAGGIGGRGPGETKLEIDRRRAKERVFDLEKRLAHLERQRKQRRSRRERSDVPVVAIVGYTNAGKSTFLNVVTESNVRAENKLFATLDPTVRRIRFPRDREVVLLDTVGFIRDLPPALMQAFSATLEEIATADLILHIVDVADPDMDQQMSVVESILKDLEADEITRWVVFNKCDKLEQPLSESDVNPTHFRISALQRKTTRPLMEAIERHLWRDVPAGFAGYHFTSAETNPETSEERTGDEASETSDGSTDASEGAIVTVCEGENR
jgi:GTP-binding protein HflX